MSEPLEPFPWTLKIEGLGPIHTAEIQPAPLMLFVGDNGTGKTMLMTVLWGVVAQHWGMVERSEGMSSYDRLVERAREFFRQPAPATWELTREEMSWLEESIKELMGVLAPRLVQRVLNNPVTLGGMKLTLDPRREALTVERNDDPSRPPTPLKPRTLEALIFRGEESRGGLGLGHAPDAQNLDRLLMNAVLQRAWDLQSPDSVQARPFYDSGPRLPLLVRYLPAARTGFMLMYKVAASSAFQSFNTMASEGAQRPALAAPAVEFLQQIAVGDVVRLGPFADEAARLEREVLGGKVVASAAPARLNEYRFTPDGGAPLEMHQSASLVTELAPLVLTLRYAEFLTLLIIEEPEAHLNPKQILALARCFVRLINRGLTVWIVTHSDLLVEQLNNLIRIRHLRTHGVPGYEGQEPPPELTRYPPEEELDHHGVTAYQFDLKEGGVDVKRLNVGPRGVPIPNLSGTSTVLSEEGYMLLSMMGSE